MIKFIFGIGVGVLVTAFYPDIVPHITALFIESGARDTVVETLMNVK